MKNFDIVTVSAWTVGLVWVGGFWSVLRLAL